MVDRHTILQGAISTFGGIRQTDRAIECMMELAIALLKERNSQKIDDYACLTRSVTDKMAEVQIAMEQLRLIYGPTDAGEEAVLKALAAQVRMRGGTQILGEA